MLALLPLSGQERVIDWAPETECAVANGFELELELPFEKRRLAELKVGAQATFGTLDNGRIVHGASISALTSARAASCRMPFSI